MTFDCVSAVLCLGTFWKCKVDQSLCEEQKMETSLACLDYSLRFGSSGPLPLPFKFCALGSKAFWQQATRSGSLAAKHSSVLVLHISSSKFRGEMNLVPGE